MCVANIQGMNLHEPALAGSMIYLTCYTDSLSLSPPQGVQQSFQLLHTVSLYCKFLLPKDDGAIFDVSTYKDRPDSEGIHTIATRPHHVTSFYSPSVSSCHKSHTVNVCVWESGQSPT